MSLDLPQVRRLRRQAILIRLDLYSLAAERLVRGTGLRESKYTYLRQICGPAMGAWQIEGPTRAVLYRNFLVYRPELKRRVIQFASWFSGDCPDPGEMIGNISYACAMCRVHYLRFKVPSPAANDAAGPPSIQRTTTTHGTARHGRAAPISNWRSRFTAEANLITSWAAVGLVALGGLEQSGLLAPTPDKYRASQFPQWAP